MGVEGLSVSLSWLLHADGVSRTTADTGAAAVTLVSINCRCTYPAPLRTKTDGIRLTTVFATAALNLFVGQAAFIDSDNLLPGLLFLWPEQGLITGFSAAVAECAFAPAEVDLRVAAIASSDDLGFAAGNAGVTAVTVGKEQLFILDPGKILTKYLLLALPGQSASEEGPAAQINTALIRHWLSFPEGQ